MSVWAHIKYSILLTSKIVFELFCFLFSIVLGGVSETVTSYVKVAAELEQLVDKMVFESYGVAERHYESHIAATTYLLRPTKYAAPPPSNINNVGANIHTDKSFSTLLFQNQINGLQVESKSGDWIAVNVPPSAFVFMAGDAYEVYLFISS